MLEIKTPESEFWDEKNERFVKVESQIFTFEHSLISISKWESKWQIPFLGKEEKTKEQMADYIRCMSLKKMDVKSLSYFSKENMDAIAEYIQSKQSATFFHDDSKNGRKSREQITSELIYYWMVAYNIPSEYEKWHLNRLLNLIRICEIKNRPPKKQPKGSILKSNAALNAARRKQLGTRG